MKLNRLAVVALLGCLVAGFAHAKPEPTPDITEGVLVGEITQKDGPKITVKGEEQTLKLMPNWTGGMPKDGGGFEKSIVKKLKEFSVGDRVQVKWYFSEHYRIESIKKIGRPE